METYSRAQLERIFAVTPPGWPPIALRILLGTGMRLSELCDLIAEDVRAELSESPMLFTD